MGEDIETKILEITLPESKWYFIPCKLAILRHVKHKISKASLDPLGGLQSGGLTVWGAYSAPSPPTDFLGLAILTSQEYCSLRSLFRNHIKIFLRSPLMLPKCNSEGKLIWRE